MGGGRSRSRCCRRRGSSSPGARSLTRNALLERDGRGRRMDQRVAWAQLGGGLLVPGGSLGGIGVGGWILHRFGMATKVVAERQFNLSFLNTAVDALALIVFGVGLATGVFGDEGNLLLTLLPAALAATGIAAALLIARRASSFAGGCRPNTRRSPARSPRSPTPWMTPNDSCFTAAAGRACSGRWPTSALTC